MKNKIIAVTILSIFLLSFACAFVSAGVTITQPTGDISKNFAVPADNWWGRFISSFKGTDTFSVYGDTLKCSKYPTDGSPITFKLNTAEAITVDNSAFVDWFRGSPTDGYYGSHPTDSRQFINEKFITNGQSTTFTCDSGGYWNNDCYVDIYSCPDPCYANSDCSSGQTCDKTVLSGSGSPVPGGAGVCITSTPTHHTNVYSCANGVKTSLGMVYYGSTNFCSDPADSKYLINTAGQCLNYVPSICTTPVTQKCAVNGCNPGDAPICSSSTIFKTCGQWQGDTCYSYNPIGESCSANEVCQSGNCVPSTAKTCVQLNGAVCSSGQTCSAGYAITGSTDHANDNLCCQSSAKCITPTQTCATKGGIVCSTAGTVCSAGHIFLGTSDHATDNLCCDYLTNCKAPETKTCSQNSGVLCTSPASCSSGHGISSSDHATDNLCCDSTSNCINQPECPIIGASSVCLLNGVSGTKTCLAGNKWGDCTIPSPPPSGLKESMTWSKFYSINEEDFGNTVSRCSSNSECAPKDGYNVSCLTSGSDYTIYAGRIQKDVTKWCSSSGAWKIGNMIQNFLIGGNFCDSKWNTITAISNWWSSLTTPPGFCVAESSTWYGGIWESTLKMVGGLGLPYAYVLMATIGIFLLIVVLIISKI